jgi:hypothetical protein
MLVTERIIVASSVVWASALLLWRLAAAWGGGRKDYSARAGSPARGVLYNFTTAMAPAHKEAARLHPFKFTVGLVMHAGVALAVVKVFIILVRPETPPLAPVPIGWFLALATAAALFLFVRRFFSPNLRPISSLDDYFAAFATALFLGTASLHEFGVMSAGVFLLIGAGAIFYIPLGKLRHVLFCPVARFDLGRRLGYRGTFPVVRGVKK